MADGRRDLWQEPAAEAELVRGLLARESSAVAEFIDRSHHAVYAIACRLCPEPDLRRDWTHDVLLRLVADLGSGVFVYRRPGGFWAWFRKRAYFLLLDEFSRNRRLAEKEGRAPSAHDGLADVVAAAGAGPDEELERAEIRAGVEHCLARIESPEQRRAITLLLVGELSYEEIAEAMDAGLNTVRSWIRRGRIALRRCLARRFGLGGEIESAE